MKKILAIFLVVILCGSLIGCDNSKSVTLTVWCAEMDRDMIQAMVDAFMEAKPAIKSQPIPMHRSKTEYPGNLPTAKLVE